MESGGIDLGGRRNRLYVPREATLGRRYGISSVPRRDQYEIQRVFHKFAAGVMIAASYGPC